MSSDNNLDGNYNNYVSLTINSKKYTVTNKVPLDTSLNTFIRDHANLKGTKYMCKEGGCGACVVAITTTNPFTNKRNTYAVNSCLFKVWSCHNADVVTIEDANKFRYKNAKLTISESLAQGNGSQCGYCSPGMVMNVYGLIQQNPELTEDILEKSFAGNICRCTGYKPILRSFRDYVTSSQLDEHQVRDIEDDSCAKLCPLKRNNASKNHEDDDDECWESCFVEHALAPKNIKMKFNCDRNWYRVSTVQEIFEVFSKIGDCSYMLINGDTAQGVNPEIFRDQDVINYIDVTGVKELKMVQITSNSIKLGGNVTLVDFLAVLKEVQAKYPSQYCYAQEFYDHVLLVANVPVRNTGTLAGNLTIKHKMLHGPPPKMFQSDIFLLLDTIGATLQVADQYGLEKTWPLSEYLCEDMNKKVIKSISLPAKPASDYKIRTYKIMPRAQNAPASVNAGFLFKIQNKSIIKSASIVYGGICETFSHAEKTEKYLINQDISSEAVLQGALSQLNLDLKDVQKVLTAFSPQYRKQLAINLFYKTVLYLNKDKLYPLYQSGADKIMRCLSSGIEHPPNHLTDGVKGKKIPKIEADIQCKGEAEYINDIPVISGQLYGALIIAHCGPGTLEPLDCKDAMMPGVECVYTAKDIPRNGVNSLFDSNFITPEAEELFAQSDVKYAGQPVGILVANTQDLAIKAARKVNVRVKQSATPLLNIDDVINKYKGYPNERIVSTPTTAPIRSMLRNSSYKASPVSETSVNDGKLKDTCTLHGDLEFGSQYHYSMELQTCVVVPMEDGQLDVYSSTQWPASVQRSISRVLGIQENKVNLSVRRLGGAYGSKVTRAAYTACACSLAAYHLKKPVRMVLDLTTNMQAMGKRCAVKCFYKVVVDKKSGKIITFDKLDVLDNKGLTLNDPVCYYIIGALKSCYDLDKQLNNAKLYGVKTDTPTSSWCRAPGSLEGIAIIESIMSNISVSLGLPPDTVRLNNMCDTEFIKFYQEKIKEVNETAAIQAVNKFNNANRWKKQGFAIIPMEFPIEFFLEFYCTVTVNGGDGSVSISHGGTEMGQGINTKAAVAAAYVFRFKDTTTIQVKPSNVVFSPNNCPTGGSMASDSISFATLKASKAIMARLEQMKKDLKLADDIEWEKLIQTAMERNINLSCTYMWTLKDQISDPDFGTLTAYKVGGICAATVEVDVLTGQHIVRHVQLWEDIGASFAPCIDLGQVQGAFIMGMGYFTSEHLEFDPKSGKLLTNRTWNYDPPGALDTPEIFDVMLENRPKMGSEDPSKDGPDKVKGVIGAKATGEPPLCLSVAVLFAIKEAIRNARKDAGSSGDFKFNPPATIENNLLNSYTETSQFKLRSK